MPFVNDAAFAGLRSAFEVTLVHRYTRTPVTSTTVDGEETASPGTPVTGVACTYSTVSRVVRTEGGTTLVSVPALTVSATDSLRIGDRVSAVTDQLGTVLLAGPAWVERVLDDTAGLGAALLPVYELRFTDPQRFS